MLRASIHSRLWTQTGVTVRKRSFGSKSSIIWSVWPWHLTDDVNNNRAPLPYHVNLCASFDGHRWIETGFTVRKRLTGVKIVYFVARVTLKFDGLSRNSEGIYRALCIVPYSITICKLVYLFSALQITGFLTRPVRKSCIILHQLHGA